MSEPLSVVLVPIREVAAVVEPWLERSAGSKPSHGIPAHVTLLFPCPADEAGISRVLADREAFDVEFREMRRFAGVLYLAPEPAERFAAITEALVARYPEWPPYGGVYEEIVPHLTVAMGAALDEPEADVAPRLPLRGRAREALLLSEVAPQRWEPQARFPLRES